MLTLLGAGQPTNGSIAAAPYNIMVGSVQVTSGTRLPQVTVSISPAFAQSVSVNISAYGNGDCSGASGATWNGGTTSIGAGVTSFTYTLPSSAFNWSAGITHYDIVFGSIFPTTDGVYGTITVQPIQCNQTYTLL
jgi:hypothetical protein